MDTDILGLASKVLYQKSQLNSSKLTENKDKILIYIYLLLFIDGIKHLDREINFWLAMA